MTRNKSTASGWDGIVCDVPVPFYDMPVACGVPTMAGDVPTARQPTREPRHRKSRCASSSSD